MLPIEIRQFQSQADKTSHLSLCSASSLTSEPSPFIAHSDIFQQGVPQSSSSHFSELHRDSVSQHLWLSYQSIRHKASFTSAAAALGAQAPVCF